ncbi:MAG: hypothetical protein EBX98_06170 [Burkholderiaceae bacterium]|nr:hypothetical protein [Burkholderiaceae bacterium]
MNTFKKTTLALAISALAGGAMAQSAPAPAPEPEKSPITANVTVVNDYRYRGISQSNFKPAIQGGFDYAHESGFYIGNWNSSISWISDGYGTSPAVSAPIEMDFYAGFKKELIGEGFASDIGVLQYYYPNSNLPRNSCSTASYTNNLRQSCGASPNTTEAYIAQNFTFGPVTGFVKFSYALTNIFGIYDSNGSYYPDLTVNYDTGVFGLTFNGHVGYQYVANNRSNYNYSYTDWKLGLTKDFGGGLSANVSYVGTNAGSVRGNPLYYSPTNKNLGKAGGLISLTKTF